MGAHLLDLACWGCGAHTLAPPSVTPLSVTLLLSLQSVVKRYVLYVFIKLHCTESVCLYYGLRVCGQKYIIIVLFLLLLWKIPECIVDIMEC